MQTAYNKLYKLVKKILPCKMESFCVVKCFTSYKMSSTSRKTVLQVTKGVLQLEKRVLQVRKNVLQMKKWVVQVKTNLLQVKATVLQIVFNPVLKSLFIF